MAITWEKKIYIFQCLCVLTKSLHSFKKLLGSLTNMFVTLRNLAKPSLIHKTLYSPGKMCLLAKVLCSPVNFCACSQNFCIRSQKVLHTTEKLSHSLGNFWVWLQTCIRQRIFCFRLQKLQNSTEELLHQLIKLLLHMHNFCIPQRNCCPPCKTFAFTQTFFCITEKRSLLAKLWKLSF